MAERERRLEEEHRLIAELHPDVIRSGDWFLIPNDARATRRGWTPDPFRVAFHAQPEHPGQTPYGIYVPSSAQVGGQSPENFEPNAGNRPPFEGDWGVLSWSGEADGVPWRPRQQIEEGSNLLDYFLTFQQRFREGV